MDRQRITIENWAEYGFFVLQGKYVDQLKPLTKIQVKNPPTFTGHQPLVFLPTFLFSVLSGSIPLGHVLGSTLWIFTLFATLSLAFGRFGWLPSLVILSSPGVIAGIATLDPVPLSLFLMLPFFVAFSRNLFVVPESSLRSRLIFLSLVSFAACLSWTSALALAIWMPWCVMKAISEKKLLRLLPHIGVLCLVCVASLFFALYSKQGQPTHDLADYFFTNTGYGLNMTWIKSLTSQGKFSSMMLWPVWFLILLMICIYHKKLSRKSLLLASVPIASMLVLFGVLRNYTAHAPTLVAAPIAVHAVTALLLAIWTHLQTENAFDPLSRLFKSHIWISIVFVNTALLILWGMVILPANRLKETLDRHTTRADLIVIDRELWGSRDFSSEFISRLFGREVILGDANSLQNERAFYFLSDTRLDVSTGATRKVQLIEVSPSPMTMWLDELWRNIPFHQSTRMRDFFHAGKPLQLFDVAPNDANQQPRE